MTSLTQSEFVAPRGGEWIIGTRQIAAITFVAIGMMTAIAGLAYMAGRTMSPIQQASAAEEPSVKQAPEQIIVVDPVGPATAASQSPAKQTPASPAAIQPAPPSAAVTASGSATVAAAPLPGESYLQVGVVERGMAEMCVEYLGRKGFPARVAAGPQPNFYRVLVGPIGNPSEVNAMKAGLQELGFRSFLKRF